MIPCYLYCRKSSEDSQKQVQSIQSQVDVMTELAQSQGFSIVETITDEKSARIPDKRAGFNKLIQLIETGTVKTILTWKTDRLSRNPKESGLICQLLSDGVIERIVTIEKTFTPAESQILFSLENAMASEYSRNLSINVKRGQQSKLERGLYPACAPVGYINQGNFKGNKFIAADPLMFPRLKALWQMLIDRTCQLGELYRIMQSDYPLRAQRRGKHKPDIISFSTFHRIFRNPFYCGLFRWQGQLHVGNHEPMLSQADFESVQDFLQQKSPTRQATNTFDFKGLFTCGNCGACVTGERKWKHIKATGTKKGFDYYKCTRKRRHVTCFEKPLSKLKLETQIIEVISKLYLPPEIIAFGKKELAKQEIDSNSLEQGKIAELEQRLRKIKKDLVQVQDNITLEPDPDIRTLMKDKLRQLSIEEKNSTEKIKKQKAVSKQKYEEIKGQLGVIERANKILETGTKHDKQTLLRSLGRNWQLQGKTIDYKPFFVPAAILKVKASHPHYFPSSEPNNPLHKNKKLTSDEVSFVWRTLWRTIRNSD